MFWGGKIVWGNALSLARIFSLFLLVLFLPKFFIVHLNSTSRAMDQQNVSSFRLGLENISDQFLKALTPKGDLSFTVGLVTNQSGKDQCGKKTLDVLRAKGLNVVAIFAPEHGADGNIGAGQDVSDVKDEKTQIKIISLYRQGTTKRFDESILHDIDILFFDMQDSGMRHYTFVTTLFQMLEAASIQNKVVVVLDRPNLLGPRMEGTLVVPSLKSAISYAPIPIRYGMTIGELALYFNKNFLEKPAKLHVVPMKNYNRHHHNVTGLLAHLSPNIKNINSCYGYSFLGLLGEVRPFDVGIGTDKAFQCLLLPENIQFSKKRWHELHLELKKLGIENSFYRYFSTRKKKYCSGLRFCISNINDFSSFNALLTILDFFKRAHLDLVFSEQFDKAMGSEKVRAFLENKITKTELKQYIHDNLHSFFNNAFKKKCFLYMPLPIIEEVL